MLEKQVSELASSKTTDTPSEHCGRIATASLRLARRGDSAQLTVGVCSVTWPCCDGGSRECRQGYRRLIHRRPIRLPLPSSHHMHHVDGHENRNAEVVEYLLVALSSLTSRSNGRTRKAATGMSSDDLMA